MTGKKIYRYNIYAKIWFGLVENVEIDCFLRYLKKRFEPLLLIID